MPSISLQTQIEAFNSLGYVLRCLAEAISGEKKLPTDLSFAQRLYDQALVAKETNPWFTRKEVARAFQGLGEMLRKDRVTQWLQSYPALYGGHHTNKKVGVIMAGNIPLVGFHDFLCVLIAGHHFIGKLSSQDEILPKEIARLLIYFAPKLEAFISFSKEKPETVDAIIATGSNNSARYFEYQYADLPRIIRKNRHSLAVLTKDDSPAALRSLGEDVFSFYGLGCRNISHLMIPNDFDLSELIHAWKPYMYVLSHKKYRHNFQHHLALNKLQQTPLINGQFFLLKEAPSISSPLAVVHYSTYATLNMVEKYIRANNKQLQCIASDSPLNDKVRALSFGKTQQPFPWDYADGVDTIEFLLRL